MPDNEPRYTAYWDETEQEVTVVQSIPAGVSGPFGIYPATSLDTATDVLFDNGYMVVQDNVISAWSPTANGDQFCRLMYMG
ncbi:hypothetical protein [Kitasatospora sp. NPDC088548]|uniref:hypothetical protein n=1 Tax=Kitasatospora sp. NPDC088548 TaxID=3364075 RepID=UPI003818B71A